MHVARLALIATILALPSAPKAGEPIEDRNMVGMIYPMCTAFAEPLPFSNLSDIALRAFHCDAIKGALVAGIVRNRIQKIACLAAAGNLAAEFKRRYPGKTVPGCH